MLTIDGASGEGGGQVLRTCLALAMATQQAVRLENIRARRAKPGLMRQHLAAVRAARQVCGAAVQGDALHSQRLTFEPQAVSAGEFHFDVGSAGSASLVLHTILPPLLIAGGPSRIVIDGGTHNPLAPPFEHLAWSFLPLINRLGARVTARLDRHGFYPAGGGRIAVDVHPAQQLTSYELLERGVVRRRWAEAILARLPRHIADRELAFLARRLDLTNSDLHAVDVADSHGPGNALIVAIESESLTAVFSAFGRKGLPAESVADDVARQVAAYLDADVPIDEHLADQLLIPLALAGRGAFRTGELSGHTRTQIDLIRQFLTIDISTEREPTKPSVVLVRITT